ncbi:MAG: hypothetical protein IPJ88_17345 [Myxococcales bacterium]|nr:MAG: hypothetical protein IPJ88_17345 [Myxococcales bacterium]
MKKLFVMMIALMFSSAVAVGCSSEEDAESTEVSSGSEYTEEQWGNAEQEATEGTEATEAESTEATDEAAEGAEETTEEATE